MSLDPPTYLNSLQNNIRSRPIPWDGAVRANTITNQDLKRIKAVDKVRKEQRRKVLEENFDSYRSLILGGDDDTSVLQAAAKRSDVIQYIVVLTGDLINDVPDFADHLLQHKDPFKPFLPLLNYSNNPDEPIPLLVSSVLSTLLAASQKGNSRIRPEAEAALTQLYKYLAGLVKHQDSGLQDIAVQMYSSVMRTPKARELFWNQKDQTLAPLFDILRSAVGVTKDANSTLWSGATSVRGSDGGLSGGIGIQLLYHILLVVWQLSFESENIGEKLQESQEIIPLYTQLLRISPKEKTTRLLLSTLLNLFLPNKGALFPVAVSVRLPALLEVIKTRHLTDSDLLEDLDQLNEMLGEYTSSQTTFDEYAAEVTAGHLRWSPPHRSEKFWRENAEKIITENNGELPKKLSEILSKSWANDKQVLAIACNDVGWLVKQCPHKRDALEKCGIKGRVMALMADTDETVRWESLRAVGEWLRYSFEGN